MTVEERRHLNRVARLGCIVCQHYGHWTPAEIHHIGNGIMGRRGTTWETIPLCPYHHRLGPKGDAIHAGRESFEARHGTEESLLAEVGATLAAYRATEEANARSHPARRRKKPR